MGLCWLQVRKGIQWLAGPRAESSRLAGVLVLQELAQAAPAVFNVHVRSFIEVIWNPLRDPKLQIREAAVAALQVRQGGMCMGFSCRRRWRAGVEVVAIKLLLERYRVQVRRGCNAPQSLDTQEEEQHWGAGFPGNSSSDLPRSPPWITRNVCLTTMQL